MTDRDSQPKRRASKRHFLNSPYSFPAGGGTKQLRKQGNAIVKIDHRDKKVAGTFYTNTGAAEFFAPSEMAQLLAARAPEFRAYLGLGAFAGLRCVEIDRLKLNDIDLRSDHITVAVDKAKAASRQPLPSGRA